MPTLYPGISTEVGELYWVDSQTVTFHEDLSRLQQIVDDSITTTKIKVPNKVKVKDNKVIIHVDGSGMRPKTFKIVKTFVVDKMNLAIITEMKLFYESQRRKFYVKKLNKSGTFLILDGLHDRDVGNITFFSIEEAVDFVKQQGV